MALQLVLNAGLKSHSEVFVILGDLIDICAVWSCKYLCHTWLLVKTTASVSLAVQAAFSATKSFAGF